MTRGKWIAAGAISTTLRGSCSNHRGNRVQSGASLGNPSFRANFLETENSMSVADDVRVKAQDTASQRSAILKLLVPMLVVLFGFEAPTFDADSNKGLMPLLLSARLGTKLSNNAEGRQQRMSVESLALINSKGQVVDDYVRLLEPFRSYGFRTIEVIAGDAQKAGGALADSEDPFDQRRTQPKSGAETQIVVIGSELSQRTFFIGISGVGKSTFSKEIPGNWTKTQWSPLGR